MLRIQDLNYKIILIHNKSQSLISSNLQQLLYLFNIEGLMLNELFHQEVYVAPILF